MDIPVARSIRASSKDAEELCADKIEELLNNNKYFPHKYQPYYDQKSVKEGLLKIL